MGKALTAAWLSLGLGACSIVTSQAPLFSAADGAGAPKFKPGVWSMPDNNCDFDPKSPPPTWPKCANATLVTGTTLGDVPGGGASKQTVTYLLAAGDPVVLQLQAPAERDPTDPVFVYAGLRPTESDRKGRMTETKVWLALCAEPPSSEKALKAKPRPLPPGLKPGKSGPYCIADDKAVVREAVRRSEAWAFRKDPTAMGLTARWVRDAEK
jgi:hypothetical protein